MLISCSSLFTRFLRFHNKNYNADDLYEETITKNFSCVTKINTKIILGWRHMAMHGSIMIWRSNWRSNSSKICISIYLKQFHRLFPQNRLKLKVTWHHNAPNISCSLFCSLETKIIKFYDCSSSKTFNSRVFIVKWSFLRSTARQ